MSKYLLLNDIFKIMVNTYEYFTYSVFNDNKDNTTYFERMTLNLIRVLCQH